MKDEEIEILEKKIIQKIKEKYLERLTEKKSIKILNRKQIEEVLKCKRSKLQDILNEKYNKMPVVTIGRNIYTTELQITKYLEACSIEEYVNYKKDIMKNIHRTSIDEILYKNDLINMFGMGEKKFKKFVNQPNSPIEFKMNNYYSTSSKLEKWFLKNEGKTINIDY